MQHRNRLLHETIPYSYYRFEDELQGWIGNDFSFILVFGKTCEITSGSMIQWEENLDYRDGNELETM